MDVQTLLRLDNNPKDLVDDGSRGNRGSDGVRYAAVCP
jgi:hypothetical protein